jgi:hypothetical protein
LGSFGCTRQFSIILSIAAGIITNWSGGITWDIWQSSGGGLGTQGRGLLIKQHRLFADVGSDNIALPAGSPAHALGIAAFPRGSRRQSQLAS